MLKTYLPEIHAETCCYEGLNFGNDFSLSFDDQGENATFVTDTR